MIVFSDSFILLRYGKFAEWAIIDNKQKVQYSFNEATSLIDIKMPHFWYSTGELLLFLII